MTKQQPRVLFYFLHLLGVGHIHRAQRLISQFAEHGIAVDVVYGGMPVPKMQFQADSVHYLPPIQAADNTYASTLDGDGNLLSESYMAGRQQELLNIFGQLDPDMILIEAYPFGRRVVRHELKALLESAQQRASKPIIASSVRDILQEKRKVGRAEETRDLITEFFDTVFVHSDPAIIELNETFPLAAAIKDKLNYTGFVVPEQKQIKLEVRHDIIVTAGGGAFGGQLMKTALEAAISNPLPGLSWCLATGPNLKQDDFDRLLNKAPSHVVITRSLNHLASYLTEAQISISQCGYNTAMDVLSVHRSNDCRAVFVPYDTEGQTEQLRRSELLEKAGYAINLPQSKLTVESLISAIHAAKTLPKVERVVNFSGATETAKLIKSMIESRSIMT